MSYFLNTAVSNTNWVLFKQYNKYQQQPFILVLFLSNRSKLLLISNFPNIGASLDFLFYTVTFTYSIITKPRVLMKTSFLNDILLNKRKWDEIKQFNKPLPGKKPGNPDVSQTFNKWQQQQQHKQNPFLPPVLLCVTTTRAKFSLVALLNPPYYTRSGHSSAGSNIYSKFEDNSWFKKWLCNSS